MDPYVVFAAGNDVDVWSIAVIAAVSLCILAAVVAAIIDFIRHLRQATRAQRGTCSRCGYDLRGCPDSDHCSECGAARVATLASGVVERAATTEDR